MEVLKEFLRLKKEELTPTKDTLACIGMALGTVVSGFLVLILCAFIVGWVSINWVGLTVFGEIFFINIVALGIPLMGAGTALSVCVYIASKIIYTLCKWLASNWRQAKKNVARRTSR